MQISNCQGSYTSGSVESDYSNLSETTYNQCQTDYQAQAGSDTITSSGVGNSVTGAYSSTSSEGSIRAVKGGADQ